MKNVLLILALTLFSTGAAARADQVSPEALTLLPPGRPVKVKLGVELIEVSQIQDHEEKFEVEFYLFLSWNDARLAFNRQQEGRDKRVVPADSIWTPAHDLMDDLDVTMQGGRTAHVRPDGTVFWRQYYRGIYPGTASRCSTASS